jgi:phospho-N-acetylmuramoyl-pentapeptide-transferase
MGFVDDYRKVARKQSLIDRAAEADLAVCHRSGSRWVALLLTDYSSVLSVPFFKNFQPKLPIWIYLVFITLVMSFSSNAVNLTDGLDGLAISVTVVAASALTAFSYITSNARFADYLDLVHIPNVAEVTILCGALVGASLGFLWYNAPPAEVFMGDVGSLAIGGAIGMVAGSSSRSCPADDRRSLHPRSAR